jgi:hypothetical protein
MQKLWDFIKRPNLQIMCIKEGEHLQAKDIGWKFPKSRERDADPSARILQDTNQIWQKQTYPQLTIIKTFSTEKKGKNIEDCKREKSNNI